MSRVDVCTEQDLPERPGPRLSPEEAASPFPARAPAPSPSTRPPPPSAESPVHRSLIHVLSTPKISEKNGHDPQTMQTETRPETTQPREPAAWVLPTWAQLLPSMVFEFESSGLNHVSPFPKNLVLHVARNKIPTLKPLQSFFKKYTPLKTNTENLEWFPDVLLSEKMSPSTFKNCKLTAHKGNMKVTSTNIKIKQNCNM